jgi:hypothetical protein
VRADVTQVTGSKVSALRWRVAGTRAVYRPARGPTSTAYPWRRAPFGLIVVEHWQPLFARGLKPDRAENLYQIKFKRRETFEPKRVPQFAFDHVESALKCRTAPN